MSDYDRIEKIIRYLDAYGARQPNLDELAHLIGLSKHHFHRLFTRWAGVTPKDFLQCLTLVEAKRRLRSGRSVLDASLDVGLSGPGRLHDLCVTLEAASPGEIKTRGAGWKIDIGFAESPFGVCCAAESHRGVCHLSFVDSRDREEAEEQVREDWPLASFRWDNSVAKKIVKSAFKTESRDVGGSLRCFVRGSQFQVRVWKALLRIPFGETASYGEVADVVCDRKASRAVGSAVSKNQLGVLIPCHRVIRGTGAVGDYRWGSARKRALVAWEAAQAECVSRERGT